MPQHLAIGPAFTQGFFVAEYISEKAIIKTFCNVFVKMVASINLTNFSISNQNCSKIINTI